MSTPYTKRIGPGGSAGYNDSRITYSDPTKSYDFYSPATPFTGRTPVTTVYTGRSGGSTIAIGQLMGIMGLTYATTHTTSGINTLYTKRTQP